MKTINILKLEYNKNKGYVEQIISFQNVFSLLHKNKQNNNYAILFPEIKGNNLGNSILIYSDNLDFLKQFNRVYINNDFIPTYFADYDINNADKYGYSYRINVLKKTTQSYIKNLIKHNFKNAKTKIDAKIKEMYEKDMEITDIVQKLKKEIKSKYPYFIYNSTSLYKKGIYNKTIFQIGTKIFDKNKVNKEINIDFKAFNNFGLIKHNFKNSNVLLPVI